MKLLSKYIEGNGSPEEDEKIISALIEAKLDRDKKKDWTQKLAKEYSVKRESKAKGADKKRRWFLLSIAAGLLLLLGTYFSWSALFPVNYQVLVDQQIAALDIMGDQAMLRKGAADIDLVRSEATRFYVSKEYEQSLQQWTKLVDANQANLSDYFYLGICELKKTPANPQGAIAALQKSKNLNSHSAEINWTLALAYLKAGEKAKGVNLLKQINLEKSYQWKQAEELLTAASRLQ